jgi:hypothetical protein
MKSNRKLFLALSLIIALSMACNLMNNIPTSSTDTPLLATPTPLGEIAPTPPAGVYPAAFSTFQPVDVNIPPAYAGSDYSLPLDLNQVRDLDSLDLSEAQRQLLAQNGFVVLPPKPGEFREFYQIYESRRYDTEKVFITTDSIYHVYHLVFDKMLRDLERDYFIQTLNILTSTMLDASYQQFQSLKGTPLEEPALRNVAFFAVAAQLLGLPNAVPPEVADLVNAELALINGAGGPNISPIWDRPDLPDDKKLIEDYSQYIPRGHYTRTEELKKYFRTMMWYGRLTYRLRDDFETQRALLLAHALRNAQASDGTSATSLWQNIYEPTTFIVGKADDLSYFEYAGLMDTVFGANADPSSYADPEKFAAFKKAAETLPPPQINSMWVWIWEDPEQATKGFRFMGQRFTLDSYVFGQLIWRKVGTELKPRGLPKALDFFAATGSDEAYNILDEMGETGYENYQKQMDKVRGEIAALQSDSWTQNLYWAWLYALQPVVAPKEESYPNFMRTRAWQRKDLQTALSSWTELKHDTILYAKQVMAEMGGGGPEVEPPHSWVEPVPEAYARLLSLALMTRTGLADRNMLSQQTASNLDNLISELQFLQKMAESELNATPISNDDYWHMLYYGGVLEQFVLASADTTDPMDRDLSDQKAALIADVATGLSTGGGIAALEEAVGQPTIIYVILPEEPWSIGMGAVFTYYEFPVPVADRMTDEQWQQMVEDGSNPPQPDWTDQFISP